LLRAPHTPGKKKGKDESEFGRIKVKIIEARNLLSMDSNGKSDPFCVLSFNGDPKSKQTSQIIKEELNPVWNEEFVFVVKEPQTDKIKIKVWDYDRFVTNDFLGQLSIPVLAASHLSKPLDDWFSLLDKGALSKSKSKKERGEIHINLLYIPPGSAEASLLKTPMSEHWEIDFGELTLEQELGRGAFGVVSRGKWRLQDVAIKLLLNQSMTEHELEEFRSETSLMMNLRPHRNVVPLLGVCSNPSKRLAIVTDFLRMEV